MNISIALGEHINVDRDAFMQHYYAYVYVRIMQALGAYGFRGFYERKAHFLQSVPYALKNLRWLAAQRRSCPIALPTLMDAFRGMLGSEKLQGLAVRADELTVRIFSFSFHRGAAHRRHRATAADLFSTRAAFPIPGAKSASNLSPAKTRR